MSGRPGCSETQRKLNDTQAWGLYDAGSEAMIHRAGALRQDLLVRQGSRPAACGLGPGPAPGPRPRPGPRPTTIIPRSSSTGRRGPASRGAASYQYQAPGSKDTRAGAQERQRNQIEAEVE